MEIIIPVLILGILGLIFGIGLGIASKKFAVAEKDQRLEKVIGLLPGANCGACGGAGCFGFAQDILSGKLSISACKVAKKEAKEDISRILNERKEG